jgi:hypothetical protein
MKNSKSEKLGTLPRGAYFVVAAFGAILAALAFVVGKFYLTNWRRGALFLLVALFLGLLLATTVVRWLTKKR